MSRLSNMQNASLQSFAESLNRWPAEIISQKMQTTERRHVLSALKTPRPDPTTLYQLLSPAAEPYLETLARQSALTTRQRFGHTMQFYAPLYVSNYCENACRYCGFNRRNQIARSALTREQAVKEATFLAEQGFRHLLLVAGEDRRHVPVGYFADLAQQLRTKFASISIEIYPLEQKEYAQLTAAGVDGLTLYQETYDRNVYADMHPAGAKKDFDRRLYAIEDGARAGMDKLGIGALLGLSDWRAEAFRTGLHALYLQKKHWRCQLAVSFPRMRKAAGGFNPPTNVSDKAIVQMLCALRLVLPDAEMVLSTRESQFLRDHILPLGITRISAASKTNPGGYTLNNEDSSDQFEVQDNRSLQEMLKVARQKGYDPVLKNWDKTLD